MMRIQAENTRKAEQLARDARTAARNEARLARTQSAPRTPSQHLEVVREAPTREDAPRRKPLHARPPAPSTKAIDPIAFLDHIRATAPAPTAPPSPVSRTVAAHNAAIHAISKDGWNKYAKGWKPIRDSGQASVIPLKDLGPILVAAQAEMGKATSRAEWKDVKELVLWMIAKQNWSSVDAWAYAELARGREGPTRVVDVWDALVRNEHLKVELELESSTPRLFPNSEPKRPAAATLQNRTNLWVAYVVSRSLLHSSLPSPPSFSTILPSLLAERQSFTLRHLSTSIPKITAALATLPAADVEPATEKALAWVRQLVLAQAWTSEAGGEGYPVVRQVKELFRKNNLKDTWEMWLLVREAVANPAVAWISTTEWDDSQKRRWVIGSKGVAGEDRESVLRPSSRDPTRAEASTEREDDVATPAAETAPLDLTASSTPLPTPAFIHASLTQAFVAAFLAGFTRLECFDEAGDIWGWLSTRSPPLSPGVVAWTALVHGYAQRGNVTSVESTILQMSATGVVPDVWTWVDRADAYFQAKHPDDAMDVVDRMFKDRAVLAALADPPVARLVYARIFVGLFANGRATEAQRVLADMGRDGTPVDIHILNIFLRYHTSKAQPDFAGVVDVFRTIARDGLEPDVFTFTMLFQAILSSGHENATQRLISIMESTGVRASSTTYGALINHLAKGGSPSQLRAAVELLDELESSTKLPANEIVYTSLIQGFLAAIPSATALPSSGAPAGSSRTTNALHPYFLAAQALQTRMAERGIKLNRIGLNAIIRAALALQTPSGINIATTAFRKIMANPHRATGLAGEETQERAYRGHVDSWHVFIEGFAQMGDWATARALVKEMEGLGFQPRSRGFLRLLDRVQRGGWAN
ncbi:hypothetical protein RQP46_001112 [Phenoliferia psychrophenolica]